MNRHAATFPGASYSGSMSVRLLESAGRRRWDDYVHAHPDGTFFHLSGWQLIIGDYLRHPTFFLYAEQDDRICGVLPLARVKSWLFGDALISLPFLVYGGPVSDNAESRDALISAASELADDLRVDYMEFRSRQPTTGWPIRDTYVTFRKEIESDPEANLKAVPRKQRAMIRKGIKAGLTAELDVDTGRLAAILTECKRNLGTPFFSPGYLQAIKDVFGDKSEILTVVQGATPIASVMSFYFRDQVLPYYGGGVLKARELFANDYMYWRVMERAARTGVRLFDYGRSQKGTGAYRFKKHWGFEPEPLHYEYLTVRKEKNPDLSPQNPHYKLLIETWRRLPLSLAKVLGPPIAKRIG